MYDDFDRLLEEHMKDLEFKKEYEALETEFNIIQAIIDARKANNLTQKQLAERTGIDQADISKLETGNSNPTLQLLERLAEGMNMVLKLEFVPKQNL
jgi:predicted transcriptional regulator